MLFIISLRSSGPSHLADDENMDEVRNSLNGMQSMSMHMSSAQLDTTGVDTDDEDDTDDFDDSPAPFLSRGDGRKRQENKDGAEQLPHPFKRSNSSAVDDKVDDWVRWSRHRLLADASVGTAPDACRALTVYKPLRLLGDADTTSANSEDEDGVVESGGGDGGDGGGDPTPSPGATGNYGDQRAAISSSSSSSPATAAASAAGGGRRRAGMGAAQIAGSGTAEVTNSGCDDNRSYERRAGDGLFGGGVGGLFGDDSGGLRGLQAGGGFAHSAADIAAGPMTDDDESGDAAVADVLSVSTAGSFVPSMEDAMEDDDDVAMLPNGSTQLTRVGTSRGAPTPEITPEGVALARVRLERILFSCDAGLRPCHYSISDEGATGVRDFCLR